MESDSFVISPFVMGHHGLLGCESGGINGITMNALTIKAHFDGERICLDEPCDLKPEAKLLVTVELRRP